MKQKTGRKLLSFLLTLAMVIGLVPGISLTAYAETVVKYLNSSGEEVSCSDYIVLTDTTNIETETWYVVTSDVSRENLDASNKTIHLILCDGCTLTANSINLGTGGELKVYAGSTGETISGSGALNVSNSTGNAVIAGESCEMTINGGVVTLSSKNTVFDQCEYLNFNGGVFTGSSTDGQVIPSNSYIGINGELTVKAGDNETNAVVINDINWEHLEKWVKIGTTSTSTTEYPLYVGGTQVTSENASNIDGNNKASYDDSTHTLTLNGYNLTVSNGDSEITYGIKYTGSDPLTINLKGENAIEGYLDYNGYMGIDYGIYITRDTEDIAADVTFTGEGSLSIKTDNKGITAFTNTNTNESVGHIVFSGSGEIDVVASGVEAIYTNYGTVTVNSGTVTANGRNGIYTQKGVSITGGIVNAIGTTDDYSDSGIGIETLDELSITGGTVIVSGEATGISAGWYGDNDTITIGENVISVTISSSGKAISGKLLNKLSGKGWTNVAGTEGETTIEAVNAAQEVSEELKKIYFSSHEHNFAYTANDATITATCSADDCSLTDHKATLTIVSPARTTYGGTGDAAATLTGLTDFNTATSKNVAVGDIKYVGREGTTYSESTTAPTDAGKYTAKITVEGKTASVDYEIAKATPTATAPTATATYGQTLANVTLTNPTGNTPGNWAWADALTTSVGNVGPHTFEANFTPDDTTNYSTVTDVNVTVTVNKANATVAAHGGRLQRGDSQGQGGANLLCVVQGRGRRQPQ